MAGDPPHFGKLGAPSIARSLRNGWETTNPTPCDFSLLNSGCPRSRFWDRGYHEPQSVLFTGRLGISDSPGMYSYRKDALASTHTAKRGNVR